MSPKPNMIKIGFLLFILITFVLGAYVYMFIDVPKMIARMEGMEPGAGDGANYPTDIPPDCPDLLLQHGVELLLYNTRAPPELGVNPRIFKHLEEYQTYLEKQPAKCPVLFMQQEYNAQGDKVYRVRQTPFNSLAGLPPDSELLKSYSGGVISVSDASRENGFNQNMYPGFDPYGLYVGRITNVDQIHDSTRNSAISDNPMDPNWGGVAYTQAQVDSGKYVGNEVTKPVYPTAAAELARHMYGSPHAAPPAPPAPIRSSTGDRRQ